MYHTHTMQPYLGEEAKPGRAERKSIGSDQGEGTARARSWGQEQQGWDGKKQLVAGGEKQDRVWGG